MGFLERYYDPTVDIAGINPGDIEAFEILRLTRSLTVVLVSSAVPRRLGGDATDVELSLDKLRARRMSHAINQSLKSWTSGRQVQISATPEDRIAGSQLVWREFLSNHVIALNSRLYIVANYYIDLGAGSEGRRAIVRLENEMNWVTHAMRD